MTLVNLWVEREKRRREHIEATGGLLIWRCNCGSTRFHLYKEDGMTCAECFARVRGFKVVPDGTETQD